MNDIFNIIVDICKNSNWDYNLDSKEGKIEFNVNIEDRTQLITAKLSESSYGPIIDIISKAGSFNSNVSKETLIDLLKFNRALVYSRTEISQYEDAILLVGRTLASSANTNEIKMMIEEVAISADGCEKEIFGCDIN